MKAELCEAFCNDLMVTNVPAGLAVGTTFIGPGGDHIGFYVIGPDASGAWMLQDDGSTVPYIEASGADLGIPTRQAAFNQMLEECGANYDDDSCELRVGPLQIDEVPQAAMRFVALLLRIQDLALLTAERAKSTWVETASLAGCIRYRVQPSAVFVKESHGHTFSRVRD
jgi:hypothetical protein